MIQDDIGPLFDVDEFHTTFGFSMWTNNFRLEAKHRYSCTVSFCQNWGGCSEADEMQKPD